MDGLIHAFSQPFLYPYLLGFGLICIRVNTVFWLTPIFGGQRLPLSVRTVMTLVISACILLHLDPSLLMGLKPLTDDLSFFRLALSVFQELMVGLFLSYAVLIVLQAVMVAGEWIGIHAGLGFAALIDPSSGNQNPILSQWYQLVMVWLLLAFNVHLNLLQGLLESFKVFPVHAAWSLTQAHYGSWVELSAWLFKYALQLALPIVLSLVLINLALGLISKSAPQFNLFSIGFALTVCLMLGLLWGSLDSYSDFIQNVFSATDVTRLFSEKHSSG